MNEQFKERVVSALIVAAGFVIGLTVYSFVGRTVPTSLRGIDLSAPLFRNVTSTTVTCNNTSSTNVLPPSTSRLMFLATNNSSQTITLCPASNCVFNASGIALNNSSSWLFEQNNSYSGAYSCISENGSTTLGISYSQGIP